jgi:hypothetical protein
VLFVASPAEDVFEPCEDLRNELLAQGYVVRPEAPLDGLYSDKAIKKEIDPALFSVHLLGAQHNDFAERQIRLAVDLGKKVVFWIQKRALDSSGAQQKRLLESIRNGEGITSPFARFLDTPVRNLISEVLHMLKPSTAAPVTNNSGERSVYLICDRSDKEDSEFAERLRETIHTSERLRVFLPEAGPPGGSIEDSHQARLRACDGVLLYRNSAPLAWLQQQACGVLLAEQILQRPAFLSKAFLVDDPDVLPGFPNVISRSPQFDFKALEPFLEPLRPAGGVHVGP